MKLILKQYLSQLKERHELDVLLPELLSEMGFNVISKPQVGTRQYGVDVATVGKNKHDDEALFLFSIKAGDLNRSEWDGNSNQALRPSINEILDVYIPNQIPNEHKQKPVVICLCFGGEIKEQVRPNVTGFIKQKTTDQISFEEWNGDKLAQLIEANFLKEDLLPKDYQGLMRKSLALLDEPQTSYQYFKELLNSILESNQHDAVKLRQAYISLGVLFTWCRDENNLEASFLSAELTLLYCWDLVKKLDTLSVAEQKKIIAVINPIFALYRQITSAFLETKIIPYCNIEHGISSSVWSQTSLDVNLKLFDILSRLSIELLWKFNDERNIKENAEALNIIKLQQELYNNAIRNLINHNPILLCPYQEKQTISIALTLLALSYNAEDGLAYVHSWLTKMLERIKNNFLVNQAYPSILDTYEELLEHPKYEEGYKESVTKSSVLYPFLAAYAARTGMKDIYETVAEICANEIPRCNLQAWYISDDSENAIWKNKKNHGSCLANLTLDMSMNEFLVEITQQCTDSNEFENLSAVKFGFHNLVLVACRHYRYPMPYHYLSSETNKKRVKS